MYLFATHIFFLCKIKQNLKTFGSLTTPGSSKIIHKSQYQNGWKLSLCKENTSEAPLTSVYAELLESTLDT